MSVPRTYFMPIALPPMVLTTVGTLTPLKMRLLSSATAEGNSMAVDILCKTILVLGGA
jgi:hypothetical protein